MAVNYRSGANVDDGQCKYVGCMDSHAANYNEQASLPGICVTIEGCQNPLADNYYPDANQDDGSCVYSGCTDSRAANFNPSATLDDGGCDPLFFGCTDSRALNYLPVFNVQGGSCSIPGCTQPAATNFLNVATFDDGSCSSRRRSLLVLAGRRLTAGCMDPSSLTYSASATTLDPSSCTYSVIGCTHSIASNYLSVATTDSGCQYAVTGCTNSLGTLNFNSLATVLGSCVYELRGCTDSIASNFAASANTDDGSCTYAVMGCTDLSALNYDSQATATTGCRYEVVGCTDPAAINYAADATVSVSVYLSAPSSASLPSGVQIALQRDAICVYLINGCMSLNAQNFNANATRDDGSCIPTRASPSPPPPSPPAPEHPPAMPTLSTLLVGGNTTAELLTAENVSGMAVVFACLVSFFLIALSVGLWTCFAHREQRKQLAHECRVCDQAAQTFSYDSDPTLLQGITPQLERSRPPGAPPQLSATELNALSPRTGAWASQLQFLENSGLACAPSSTCAGATAAEPSDLLRAQQHEQRAAQQLPAPAPLPAPSTELSSTPAILEERFVAPRMSPRAVLFGTMPSPTRSATRRQVARC